MKTVDYINTLIKEKEELRELCKSHVETMRLLKREIGKLNVSILRKDNKIQKMENNSIIANLENELNALKKEHNNLKDMYADLQSKYDEMLQKNNTTKNKKSKNELSKLRTEYSILKKKYDDIVLKNAELVKIFDDIENSTDSD